MLNCIFRYFKDDLKDEFFVSTNNYESLSEYDKINIATRLVFTLGNGVLEVEKPRFLDLLKKIASNNNKKVSMILSKQIFEINLEDQFIQNLAFVNFEIAKKLLQNPNNHDDLLMINICKDSKYERKLAKILAQRSQLSETITDYLVSLKCSKITTLLLKNFSANISVNSLVEVFKNFESNIIIYELILKIINSNSILINEFFCLISDTDKKRILISLCKLNPYKIYYYNVQQNLFSFNFEIDNRLKLKLKSTIDDYHTSGSLNELVMMKYLCSGDIYSYIYSISKVTGIKFESVKNIVLQNYKFIKFEEMLKRANFSTEMIKASQEVLKIYYELSLEGCLESLDFTSIIKKRFHYIDKNLVVYKTIYFLINLIS